MLRVTIDLISAITGETSTIGTMFIANDGTGTASNSSYDVAVCRRGSEEVPCAAGVFVDRDRPKAARCGKVRDYPRQAYNVWRLISRAILSAFPEEQKIKPGKAYTAVVTPEVIRGLKILTAGEYNTPNEDVAAAREWLAATEGSDESA